MRRQTLPLRRSRVCLDKASQNHSAYASTPTPVRHRYFQYNSRSCSRSSTLRNERRSRTCPMSVGVSHLRVTAKAMSLKMRTARSSGRLAIPLSALPLMSSHCTYGIYHNVGSTLDRSPRMGLLSKGLLVRRCCLECVARWRLGLAGPARASGSN